MEQVWTPTEPLKKKILYSLIGGELFVLLLLSVNVFGSYSIITSLVILGLVIAFCAGANIYVWQKVSLEYFACDDNGMEWTGNRCEWAYVEEVRLRREKEKPMFLVIRASGEYHKIPLRLYEGQIDVILAHIKQVGFEITE